MKTCFLWVVFFAAFLNPIFAADLGDLTEKQALEKLCNFINKEVEGNPIFSVSEKKEIKILVEKLVFRDRPEEHDVRRFVNFLHAVKFEQPNLLQNYDREMEFLKILHESDTDKVANALTPALLVAQNPLPAKVRIVNAVLISCLTLFTLGSEFERLIYADTLDLYAVEDLALTIFAYWLYKYPENRAFLYAGFFFLMKQFNREFYEYFYAYLISNVLSANSCQAS